MGDIMINILEEIRKRNPYPDDVFTEPTEKEYAIVRELFKNAGLIQDKFFGAYGRRVWNNCIDEFENRYHFVKTGEKVKSWTQH
jgi:hypothetical protein